MSDSTASSFDSSIPVLTDVLVAGAPERHVAGASASASVASPRATEPAGLEQNAAAGLSAEAFEVPEALISPSDDLYLALNADLLAERLKGRCVSYLTGEGRSLVETRCRDALQGQMTWLVNQVTREVALSLEAQMGNWVREAVREELGLRAAETPGGRG
ncbi:DUF2486 family protein [Paraburkholderia bonniea]|uniref:DUF2486 family protein n=1 Tax=Paraburkholderia bonniea TaxID=2152891 RepID=UPI0025731F99|nr:DUF2486 family protein [Paraburkholderia bonniea]WJF89555.1 DUF2486 family protein [Paraburkholderia bonniea]WJF92869.1 DUF2486 family protein [Paraburkholderia bonniea]